LLHGLRDNQAYDSVDPADILELVIGRRFAGRKIWRGACHRSADLLGARPETDQGDYTFDL
jgi:hypothetical protein